MFVCSASVAMILFLFVEAPVQVGHDWSRLVSPCFLFFGTRLYWVAEMQDPALSTAPPTATWSTATGADAKPQKLVQHR